MNFMRNRLSRSGCSRRHEGMKNTVEFVSAEDSALVSLSENGDREAFGALVSRHQGAVSAVAYSFCGNFHTSEDVAQEVFVSAWARLAELREKGRFRSWVCGMARNIAIGRIRRKVRRREPDAECGEAVEPSVEPSAEAMLAEEASLIWSCVESMSEIYREPLLLFYREERSTAAVASAMGISEDAVRQRLSRARAMLREDLSRRVEGALLRSRPGAAFTAMVTSSLTPLVAGAGLTLAASSAKAATAGGGGAVKTASLGLGATLAQLASGLVGVLGFYLLFRFLFAREIPRSIRMMAVRGLVFSLGLVVVFVGMVLWVFTTETASLGFAYIPPVPVSIALIVAFVTPLLLVYVRISAKMKQMDPRREAGHKSIRKRSRIRFAGLPLYDIAFGPLPEKGEKLGRACGWLALGDLAFGAVAFGSVAFGLVSFGGCVIGLLSVGGIAIGAFVLGGVGAGWVACAGIGLGWVVAAGGFAVAQGVAVGGVAVSATQAIGGVALAPIANTGAADALMNAPGWPGNMIRLLPYAGWLSLLGLPGLIVALRYFHGSKRVKVAPGAGTKKQ